MRNKTTQSAVLTHIKRKAKAIGKEQGIKHALALDQAAILNGFENYRHALNLATPPLAFKTGHSLRLSIYWQDWREGLRGRESISIALSKPWETIIRRSQLLNARSLGGFAPEDDNQQKIKWLDHNLYPEPWHWTWYGVVSPALAAAFYVLVSPHLLRAFSIYHRNQQHKSAEAILAADKIQPVSPDHAYRLMGERSRALIALKNANQRFVTMQDDYLTQIENLNSSVEQNKLKTITVPIENEEESSFSDTSEIVANEQILKIAKDLSLKGRSLLQDSSKSNSGSFLRVMYLGGLSIQIEHQSILAEGAPPREVAEWDAAITELEQKRLVNKRDKGIYTITKLGYEVSDALLSLVLKA